MDGFLVETFLDFLEEYMKKISEESMEAFLIKS